MLIVRKGYSVFCNSLRIAEGGEIPLQFYDMVLKDQAWKVEDKDGQKEKESEKSRDNGKKEEIKDIVVNRMIKDKEVKKK